MTEYNNFRKKINLKAHKDVMLAVINKKIVRKITLALFLILASTDLLSQTNSDSTHFKTILFKITHKNTQKTSYLFGTHHAFGKTFFDSLINANRALESCDVLIKENLNIPGKMAENIINERTTKTKWHKYFSKEDFIFIKNLFNASPTDYNKMTPTEMYVFLNRHFKQQICLNKSVNDTSLSLDDYIGSRATEHHIALCGLETTEEQIDLVNRDVAGMPKRSHKRRLANIINKIRHKKTDACGETAWYSQMEIDYQLHQPCENTLVLTDRNNRWIKKIKELLETKNCFIAVGLSHLMYDCGLINQLQDLGYIITPINLK